MKNLQITYLTDPTPPGDGEWYVFYNPNINVVWIFKSAMWILEDAQWNMDETWVRDGIWKMAFSEIYKGE